MEKLNLAIIGQGRCGKDIHGLFYRSEDNNFFNVKYVVEWDDYLRNLSEKLYPGCKTFDDYTQLFKYKDDIDIVVNTSFSEMHYEITKNLLEHGFNVLVDKPFARNHYECNDLINIAKSKGLILAVFQQTFFAPFYKHALEIIKSGILGEIKQINLRYNSLVRRWDWQTLQKRMGGSAYNTGPHPIGMALGFLDFDKNMQVVFTRLGTALTSGDAEDYVKILLTAPQKPVVDIEISSIDAYCDYTIKIQGTKGTFKNKPLTYRYKYIADGENEPKPVVENTLKDANGDPIFCAENLKTHEFEGKYEGTAFNLAVADFYANLYYALKGEQQLIITPQMACEIIRIIERAHADNPLPLKY